MRQRTLGEEGFEKFRKPTRREQFLEEMDQIIPWRDLCKVIKPFYPKPKGPGRRPLGLERMLRSAREDLDACSAALSAADLPEAAAALGAAGGAVLRNASIMALKARSISGLPASTSRLALPSRNRPAKSGAYSAIASTSAITCSRPART